MKRKDFYKIVAGAVFAISSLVNLPASAEKHTHNAPITISNALFIQVANKSELIPIEGKTDTYKLVLKDIYPFTHYFAQRPSRVTGAIPTAQFINLWQNPKNAHPAPNVALESSDIKNGKHFNRVLMLHEPVYDANKHELSYTAKILGKGKYPTETIAMGYTILFIDNFNWGGNTFG